jgi:4-amino-4-deoxy-L-arabinose transferase-like glycosyltransferase
MRRSISLRQRLRARAGAYGALIGAALLLVTRVAPALFIFAHPERALFADSHGYVGLAAQLSQGLGYADPSNPGMDLLRPPAFPLLLAGLEVLGLGDFGAVVLVQLLMGAVVSLLLCTMGRLGWSLRSGRAAGLLYALLPNVVLWAMAILSDTMFVLLVVVAAYCLLRYRQTRRVRWAAASGLLVGLGTLTRPIGLVLVPLWLCLLIGMHLLGERNWRQVLVASAAFAAASAALILPWAWRNERAYGIFATSTIDIVNLGYYQAPAAVARGEGVSLDEARSLVGWSPDARPGDRIRYLSVIARYPLDYLWAHAQGTWVTLSEAGQPNMGHLLEEHYRFAGVLVALRSGDLSGAVDRLRTALGDPVGRWFVAVPWFSLAVQLLTYGLAIRGCLVLLRRRTGDRWLGMLLLGTAAVFVLLPGPVGNGRFRLPAEPFLCLLAGAGISARRDLAAAVAEDGSGVTRGGES